MPKELPCPVRDFLLVEGELNDTMATQEGWVLANDSNGPMRPHKYNNFSLYVTLNSSALPVTTITMGEGDGICTDENKRNLDSSRTEDYLWNVPKA